MKKLFCILAIIVLPYSLIYAQTRTFIAEEFPGTPQLKSVLLVNLPAAGTAGRLMRVTDILPGIYYDTGTAWVRLSDTLTATLPSSTLANLPAAGTAGRQQRVTDNQGGFWDDTGVQWKKTLPLVNIKDAPFNAKGDGTPTGGGTDDTAAIQAAIDATPRGGTLLIPAAEPGKCYRLTDSLKVNVAGIRILGTGWQFRQADSWVLNGSVLCQTGPGKIGLELGTGAVGAEIDGMLIENIAIGGVAGTSDAVRQQGVHRSTFRNIYIAGAGAIGWNQMGGTSATQNVLNYYDGFLISTGFGVAQGYAAPTIGIGVYSGPSTWTNLHIAGVNINAPGICLDLDGPNSDGEGTLYQSLSLENCTINVRFGANSISNLFLNTYSEGPGTVSGQVASASGRSNLAIGWVAGGLTLPNTVGSNIQGRAGRIRMWESVAAGTELSPFNAASVEYGSIHASRTGVTNVWNTTDVVGGVPGFFHTDTDLANVTIMEGYATGLLNADSLFKIGANSFNLGDIGIAAYKRSSGAARNVYVKRLVTDVIATASLPAAAASENGRIIIEDAGAGDRNIVFYSNGQRFRVDGGLPF